MKLKEKLAINYIRARLNILSLVSARTAAEEAFALFCTPRRKYKRKPAPVFEQGEKLSFRLEGHTIRGHRWRPHQASGPDLPKVLIVHGFESSSVNYVPYIQALLKKGYEVLAFDAPAHGKSGGKRITLPLYIKALATIREQYGPIHSCIAHSLGGLALILYLESAGHPPPDKLVLIAPVCELTNAAASFFQLLLLNEEVRSAFNNLALETSGKPFSFFSIRRALPQIKAGILWVQDEEDTVTPLRETLEVQSEGHPNIQFLITRGLGHRQIYRDPDIIRKITAFV